jgi:MYXO-CTERM domain-containing protein
MTTSPDPGTSTPTDVIVTPPPLDPPNETATLARPSTDTPTSDAIITPGAPETDDRNASDEPTVTGGQPGFTALGALAVLLLFLAVGRRRS